MAKKTKSPELRQYLPQLSLKQLFGLMTLFAVALTYNQLAEIYYPDNTRPHPLTFAFDTLWLTWFSCKMYREKDWLIGSFGVVAGLLTQFLPLVLLLDILRQTSHAPTSETLISLAWLFHLSVLLFTRGAAIAAGLAFLMQGKLLLTIANLTYGAGWFWLPGMKGWL